jgi:uncharacterized protein (DUF1697 family)
MVGMPRYVTLLRAINVAGHNLVSMAALRTLLTDLGVSEPRTILQSGNVVFDAARKSAAKLESEFEHASRDQLQLEISYFVRTAVEWQRIIADNPFPEAAESDPGHLVVMCLKAAPTRERVAALQAAIRGRETIAAAGKQLYIVYPDGIGRSKLTGKLIEQHLGTQGTGRNWNTVLKIEEMLES